MNVITGDLLRFALDGRFDVIVHGCNCQCAMGKGIALSIKEQFPEAYAADLATAKGIIEEELAGEAHTLVEFAPAAAG